MALKLDLPIDSFLTSNKKIMVLDTETSGFIPKGKKGQDPYIVQLSYLILENFKIIKKVDKLVKLKYNMITEEAYKIHNISFDKCKKLGVDIKDLLLDLMIDLESIDIFVGHNFQFDFDMLQIEMKRLVKSIDAGFPMKFLLEANLDDLINIRKEKIYCTMKYGKPICQFTYTNKNEQLIPKNPKLSELYKHLFNRDPINMHNSFNDIIATLRCFYMLYDGIDISEFNEEVKEYISYIEEGK